MLSSRTLLSLCVLIATVTAAAPATELNDDNFDSLVLAKQKELWLVMFYAPWCGHCKHLKPVFDKAAPKARSYGMRLGKMDATANSIVPKRYEVKGYPTLLYYRKNKHQKYKAGRSAEGFVEFAKIMKKPAVVQVSNLHSLQAINKKRPVAFFLGQPTVKKTTSTSLYKLFEAAAFTLQDQFLHIGFASHASNQDEIVRADTKSPFPKDQSYIVRLEKDEEPRYYPFDDENFSIDDLTVEKLIDWIEYERHQIFTPLTKENFYLTSHSKQNAHLVVSIVNTDDAKETHRVISATHALARAARPPTNHIYSTSDSMDGDISKPNFLYGWLDGVEYSDFMEQYSIFGNTLPQVVVFDAPTEKHYHETDVSVPDGIEQFVKDVSNGLIYSKRQGFWGYIDMTLRLFYEFYPYSIGVVGVTCAMLIYVLVQCKRCICEECGDDDDDLEYYKMKEEAMAKAKKSKNE